MTNEVTVLPELRTVYYIRDASSGEDLGEFILNSAGRVELFSTMHAATRYGETRHTGFPFIICDLDVPADWYKTNKNVEPGKILTDIYPHTLAAMDYTNHHPEVVERKPLPKKRLITLRRVKQK
jgi:hypothetical protein